LTLVKKRAIDVIVRVFTRIFALIEKLKTLSRDELIKYWYKYFDAEPPKGAKKDLLLKHIAWQMQAKKFGGYSAMTLKRLDKLADAVSKGKEISENSVNSFKKSISLEIKAGTKLIREFKGEKHEVIALEKYFKYKDKTYKSFSSIANEITGTRWNGKVFFGVKHG
jgi:hypothetical protein